LPAGFAKIILPADVCSTLLTTMCNDKRFYQSALRISSGEVSSYLSRASRIQFVEVLRALGAENNIEPQSAENDMLIAEFFGFGLSGVVLSWVQRGMKESPEELTAKIENLIEICKKLATKQ